MNYNWSYFLIKLFNQFELNDGKYLQLNGIKRLKQIVVPSMVNVVFPIYAISKDFFLRV
jgi:hypothetical protein